MAWVIVVVFLVLGSILAFSEGHDKEKEKWLSVFCWIFIFAGISSCAYGIGAHTQKVIVANPTGESFINKEGKKIGSLYEDLCSKDRDRVLTAAGILLDEQSLIKKPFQWYYYGQTISKSRELSIFGLSYGTSITNEIFIICNE